MQDAHTKSEIQTKTAPIDEKRRKLLALLKQHPHDDRVKHALRATFKPEYIRLAAETGVFISYGRSDEIFALEVDTALREAGIPVWLDTIDVVPDADWDAAVEAALMHCGVMLALLSPGADSDPKVRSERHEFAQTGKVIVPVLMKPCDDAHHYVLRPVDYHDDPQNAQQKLITLLSRPARN